jgi:hypothetical protein
MRGFLSLIKAILLWIIFASTMFGANLAANFFLYEAESQTASYTYCFSFPDRTIRCKTMSELDSENQPSTRPNVPVPKHPKRPKRGREPLES